jgi:hypothetical protein
LLKPIDPIVDGDEDWVVLVVVVALMSGKAEGGNDVLGGQEIFIPSNFFGNYGSLTRAPRG